MLELDPACTTLMVRISSVYEFFPLWLVQTQWDTHQETLRTLHHLWVLRSSAVLKCYFWWLDLIHKETSHWVCQLLYGVRKSSTCRHAVSDLVITTSSIWPLLWVGFDTCWWRHRMLRSESNFPINISIILWFTVKVIGKPKMNNNNPSRMHH